MANITYILKDVDGISGQVRSSYMISESNGHIGRSSLRIDEITKRAVSDKEGPPNVRSLERYIKHASTYLQTLFLPVGFPHSVTDDYIPYQIYDSIQAFASSIAGLLSARAVLQSLDLISTSSNDTNTPTSAATAATLLSILQSTLANVTSILFASQAAPLISSEVKYYRFLADVVNDAAFVLDLLAPMLASFSGNHSILSLLPISPRALVLCTSSMLRAICGVAGGSSKAVLSNHFAHSNPDSVGDLNAKDGSQETVVGLVGMWVGGILVSRVESHAATWWWMIALLCLHLWANFRAVQSIKLRILNRERASLVCNAILISQGEIENDNKTSIEAIRSSESVLGMVATCRSMLARCRGDYNHTHSWKTWEFGIQLQKVLRDHSPPSNSNNVKSKAGYIDDIMRLFESEAYILHWNMDLAQALVIFKVEASATDQLKAWLHASCMQARSRTCHMSTSLDEKDSWQMALLRETLSEMHMLWERWLPVLIAQGWDLQATNLENGQFRRLEIEQGQDRK